MTIPKNKEIRFILEDNFEIYLQINHSFTPQKEYVVLIDIDVKDLYHELFRKYHTNYGITKWEPIKGTYTNKIHLSIKKHSYSDWVAFNSTDCVSNMLRTIYLIKSLLLKKDIKCT